MPPASFNSSKRSSCAEAPGLTNTGSFFTYECNLGGSNNWGFRGEFMSTPPGFIDEFSKSLCPTGDRLLTGAPNTNFVTLFRRGTAGSWNEIDRLARGDSANMFFGAAVALFANHALIGMPRWPNTSVTDPRWGAVSSWLQPICPGAVDGIFCDSFED